ncbi:MAG: hypothetical protein K2J37_02870 [Ruminococcus sp.]|nr:hypothetical protein [Ruminococcus sp.]MDE6784455.1 hypothetical protein [Ruminococcus sp.]
MDIGIIAVIIMAILGLLMFFAPKMCTKAEQRDDPIAVSQVKKLGILFIAGAVGASLMMLKYKLR